MRFCFTGLEFIHFKFATIGKLNLESDCICSTDLYVSVIMCFSFSSINYQENSSRIFSTALAFVSQTHAVRFNYSIVSNYRRCPMQHEHF
jgi:hypothetical protein